MTNSEAIDILAEHAQNKADEGNELLCDALKIAIRAIKKQMPRRVEEIQSVLYRCPECGSEDVFIAANVVVGLIGVTKKGNE